MDLIMQKLLEHKEKRPPNLGFSGMLAEGTQNISTTCPDASGAESPERYASCFGDVGT